MSKNLFKAKRTDNGEWIKGDLYTSGKWLSVFDKNAFYIGNAELLRAIEPSTICKHTGYEHNGEKKWEGDVFECSDGDEMQRYVIEWDKDALCWIASDVFDSYQIALGEFNPSEIDVIGNIFDNPELLEVQQK